jgi:pyrroloquinoline-quinone synthase
MNRRPIEEVVEGSLARIRCHRFIRASVGGGLELEQVQRWLFCAGRESRAFPAILEGMLARTSNPILARVLGENLDDEYGNGNPGEAHFQHYLRLLDLLGIPRADFEMYGEGPGIQAALGLADYCASRAGEAEALGYLLVNEAMTPVIYAAVERALLGLGARPETRFFELHVAVDAHHVAMLYRALESVPERDAPTVREGVLLGERGMAVLLDEATGRLGPSPVVALDR